MNTGTVILDNEAVQALRDVSHRKHKVVAGHLAAVTARRRRGRAWRVVVPATVRVEAGWDRTQSSAAAINRFRIGDAALDTGAANGAARLRAVHGLSVADAHVGHVARRADGDVVVLTSDPGDISAAVGSRPARLIAI